MCQNYPASSFRPVLRSSVFEERWRGIASLYTNIQCWVTGTSIHSQLNFVVGKVISVACNLRNAKKYGTYMSPHPLEHSALGS
jgi:hypothetical protein